MREALQKVEATVSLRPEFDPATGNRHFAVCASEATVLALLTEVLREVELCSVLSCAGPVCASRMTYW